MGKELWIDDRRVELLKELHFKGLSRAEIARRLSSEFGERFTRLAVIGKACRLGLSDNLSKQSTERKARARKRIVVIHAPAQVVHPKTDEELEEEYNDGGANDGIDMTKLRANTCRWPLGKMTDHPPYKYCGKKTEGGGAWCPYHKRMSKRK